MPTNRMETQRGLLIPDPTLVPLTLIACLYTVGRPVIREVLRTRIWGVPPACMGSR